MTRTLKVYEAFDPWIGVDLDRTLAFAKDPVDIKTIGPPVPKMLTRVKRMLTAGKTVKIFTARAHGRGYKAFMKLWRPWSKKHFGQVLPVTNEKDPGMIELWDDRARSVKPNSGIEESARVYRHVILELTSYIKC